MTPLYGDSTEPFDVLDYEIEEVVSTNYPYAMDERCQNCDGIFGSHSGASPDFWCPPHPFQKDIEGGTAPIFAPIRECIYPRRPTAEEMYEMLSNG